LKETSNNTASFRDNNIGLNKMLKAYLGEKTMNTQKDSIGMQMKEDAMFWEKVRENDYHRGL
jgi:hypothetical protein